MNWRTRAAHRRRASLAIIAFAMLGAAAAGPAAAQSSDIAHFTNDAIRREMALRQQELDLFRQRAELQDQLARGFQERGLTFQPSPLSLNSWGASTPYLSSLRDLSSAVPGGLSDLTRQDLNRLLNKERELIHANRNAVAALQDSAPPPFTFNPVFNVESNANAVNNNASRNDNVLRNDPRTNVDSTATADLDSRFDLTAGNPAANTIPGARAFAPASLPSRNAPDATSPGSRFDPRNPFDASGSSPLFERPLNDIRPANPADAAKIQLNPDAPPTRTQQPLSQDPFWDRFLGDSVPGLRANSVNPPNGMDPQNLRNTPDGQPQDPASASTPGPNQDPSRFSSGSASDTASRLQLGADLDGTPDTLDDPFPFAADFRTGASTETGTSGTGTTSGHVNNQADARSTLQTSIGPIPGTGTGTASFPGFSANLSSDSRSRSGITAPPPLPGTNAFAPNGNASGAPGRFEGPFPAGNAFGLRQGLQPQTTPGSAIPGTGTTPGTGFSSGTAPGM